MRKIGDPWTAGRKDKIYRRTMGWLTPGDRLRLRQVFSMWGVCTSIGQRPNPHDRVRLREVSKFIASVGDSVLDLGCGAGLLSSMIDDKRYLGVDRSSIQLRCAREHCKNPNATFMQADITKLLDKDVGQFDCVVCADVLEHLADPHALAQLALRHAKMRVIITLPVSMGGYDHCWVDFSKEDVEKTIFGKPAWFLEQYWPRSVRWIGVWLI